MAETFADKFRKTQAKVVAHNYEIGTIDGVLELPLDVAKSKGLEAEDLQLLKERRVVLAVELRKLNAELLSADICCMVLNSSLMEEKPKDVRFDA